jgi:hypothetical protein
LLRREGPGEHAPAQGAALAFVPALREVQRTCFVLRL